MFLIRILLISLIVTFTEPAAAEENSMGFTVEEIYNAGVTASDAMDYAGAAAYFELAAERGLAKAQNSLAYLYEEGLGVEQSYEKAILYYQLAADQGLASAQYNLGLEYEEGHGVEQSCEMALEYYQLAADQGHAMALNKIGQMYEKGSGVKQDYEKAMEYYQAALDKGSDYARICIGYMYENGWAVEQSLDKAVEYYHEAADNGEEAADEQLNRLVDEGKIIAYVVPHDEEEDREWLYALNRESIANMSIENSPAYVIGHCSPDSDTVCSAIAYARLLTMLGYTATAGVEAPPVMEDAAGKSIFLVDHSEYAQAVKGMEDAHIVGIIDHHGVGSVTTGHQLVYEAKPIGATATIIWLDYLNYGIEIDKTTATLLLGAILSDTANLTGTTVTEADRQAVVRLAGLAGITDVKNFYQGLHSEALSYDGMTSEEILFSDYKEYEVSGVKFGIGMVSVIDEDHAREMAERMKEALPQGFESVQVDLLYAGVGIREDDVKTDFIVSCDGLSRDVFEVAFPGYDEYDGTSYIFRNGGLGRKSKFVPGLTEYLNAHPHE